MCGAGWPVELVVCGPHMHGIPVSVHVGTSHLWHSCNLDMWGGWELCVRQLVLMPISGRVLF